MNKSTKVPFKPITMKWEEGDGDLTAEEIKGLENILNKILKNAHDNPQADDDDEVTDLPEYAPLTRDSVQAVFVGESPKNPKKKK